MVLTPKALAVTYKAVCYSKGTVILAAPSATVAQAKNWAKSNKATDLFISLVDTYWKICSKSGVDPAVAYAQSAKETNFGRFTGVLNKNFHNPCGLKRRCGGGNYEKWATSSSYGISIVKMMKKWNLKIINIMTNLR